MEMEVLTWIPEFYNQLQDTLKEWLLASLPFVYGQKPFQATGTVDPLQRSNYTDTTKLLDLILIYRTGRKNL